MIPALLTEFWKPIGIVGAVILVLIYVGVLRHQLDHARLELADANHTIEFLQDAGKKLHASIDEQNAQIKKLQDDEKARAEAAQAALDAATLTAKKYQEKAFELLKTKGTGDECRDTAKLLDEYVGSVQ